MALRPPPPPEMDDPFPIADSRQWQEPKAVSTVMEDTDLSCSDFTHLADVQLSCDLAAEFDRIDKELRSSAALKTRANNWGDTQSRMLKKLLFGSSDQYPKFQQRCKSFPHQDLCPDRKRCCPDKPLSCYNLNCVRQRWHWQD